MRQLNYLSFGFVVDVDLVEERGVLGCFFLFASSQRLRFAE